MTTSAVARRCTARLYCAGAARHKSPSEGIALRKCARTLAVPDPLRSMLIRRPPFVSPEPYSVCSLIFGFWSHSIWTHDSHSYREPRSDRSESPLAGLVADRPMEPDGRTGTGRKRNATRTSRIWYGSALVAAEQYPRFIVSKHALPLKKPSGLRIRWRFLLGATRRDEGRLQRLG